MPHPAHPSIQYPTHECAWSVFDVLFQLTVAVLACLLFLASAIPMPFNAAALPGGWHYNGDVGRSRFCCCCIGCCWVPGGWHYNGNVGRFCFCSCCWVSRRVALQRRCRIILLLLLSYSQRMHFNEDVDWSGFYCCCCCCYLGTPLFFHLFLTYHHLFRAPNFAIAEHTWPGLVNKEFTFGGK